MLSLRVDATGRVLTVIKRIGERGFPQMFFELDNDGMEPWKHRSV